MAVTFQNAAAQPIANAEVIVATIAGPLDGVNWFTNCN